MSNTDGIFPVEFIHAQQERRRIQREHRAQQLLADRQAIQIHPGDWTDVSKTDESLHSGVDGFVPVGEQAKPAQGEVLRSQLSDLPSESLDQSVHSQDS